MNEKKFSPEDDRYFGISFLHLDEYDGTLVSRTVKKMVARQNEVVFVEAVAVYDSNRRSLTIEGTGVLSDQTDENVALGGLIGCVNAVRGLGNGNYPLAS